jgi:2-haloacid dehalogenase
MIKTISRRKFARAMGLAIAGAAISPPSFVFNSNTNKIKAIAFDGFPIFDPGPVFKKVIKLVPEKGNQLIEIWKLKQFSYQWLRANGNKYKDFWAVTKDALEFAAAASEVSLSGNDIKIIMNEYQTINIWPDVIPALQQLKNENLKLCFLTNMTEEMIKTGIQNSNTEKYFDHIISTDRLQTYKPNPSAYQMGIDTLKLKKEEILFAAFAGWDVAGAKWFGYPTYWVNRLNSPAEKLDAKPDGIGKNLTDLVDFVKEFNKEKITTANM